MCGNKKTYKHVFSPFSMVSRPYPIVCVGLQNEGASPDEVAPSEALKRLEEGTLHSFEFGPALVSSPRKALSRHPTCSLIRQLNVWEMCAGPDSPQRPFYPVHLEGAPPLHLATSPSLGHFGFSMGVELQVR